ncbi:MAG: PAS domain-containing protein, partial [Vicinamibacteria bacterium]
HSIERARAGVYPKDIEQDLSPERLKRFFTETPRGYRIKKAIRDLCVFSRHNVLSDPPFSRLDLISCRNLLIYLEPVLQQKVMPTLHYALKPGGLLWLGGSESTGVRRTLFRVEDPKNKIYSKIVGVHAARAPLFLEPTSPGSVIPPTRTLAPESGSDLNREADRLLSTRFAPPGVLVSSNLDILQYRGDTSPYLSPAPGKPSINLLKMMRESMVVSVRAAVLRAGEEGVTIRESGLRARSDHDAPDVSIEVIPVKAPRATEPGFLILFHSSAGPNSQVPRPVTEGLVSADPSTERRLEQELAATRGYLQSLIDQQETANEALQAANEEAQSANEELQSTNEELETSKEEIESSSEELATINDELNERNRELNRANNDLVNLFASIQTAVVLVGSDLRIRRYTPLAESLLNLIPTDVGRPLADVTLNLQHLPDLTPLLKGVFDNAESKEFEVRDKEGRWYSLRLRPYRTLDNTIDGVVVVVVDIDLLKRAHNYTESIVATVREPLLVLDSDLRVRSASASFYSTYLVSPDETIGRNLYDLGNGQWNIKELRRVLEEILPQQNQVTDFEVEHHFDSIGTRTVRLNARRLVQLKEHDPLILLAIEDVTESKRQATALRQLASDLSEADRGKNEFLAMLAHELRNPLAPILNAVEILQVPEVREEDTVPAFAMLTRQLKQMVRLVDDLMDVSRISLGKIDLRRERLDLTSIVRGVADASRPNIARQEQQLTVVLPPEPVQVFVDPTRFSQVIGNLLNNASKFSPPKTAIWLSLAREGTHAVIRVRDSGMGIAADQIRRIFDLFVQGDTSLERSVSGLGIGLTLVKRLVEAHEGTVDVRSGGLGEGSEFIVRLPLLMAEPRTSETAPRSAGLGHAPKRRVLVVDDNRDAADSLCILLKLHGHETQSANDGEQALLAAERMRPEVILLDIGLPKLNGYEVCRLIRAQPWGASTVILACTGWGEIGARQASRDAGFTAHLVKPINPTELESFLV